MTDDTAKFAIRSNENSPRMWTLTSLAVRIAHALGLHREKWGGKYTLPHSPFEREMRRRLWWQLSILDRQASIDRGSDPIITTNSFSTQLPLNVNDEDLIPDNPNEIQSRDEYTDVTLSLVCHEVANIERRLNYVPAGESDRPSESIGDLWAQRKAMVIECQRRVEDKYLRHCDMTVPIQRYTKLVADIMIATMWLCTYRPLQRHPHNPTSARMPYPGILYLSVEVMEKAIQVPLDGSNRPFSWISTIWVQWHSLAVMIAELCVQTKGPTVERAWAIANIVFEETGKHVADSDKGKLWRPIKKLMNKAQAVRKKHLEDTATSSSSSNVAAGEELANGVIPGPSNQRSDMERTWKAAPPNMVGNTSGLAQGQQQHQQNGIESAPGSMSWDLWTATGPTEQMDYSNEMDRMAWTHWETFIDDFQGDGDFVPGPEGMIPPPFDMW